MNDAIETYRTTLEAVASLEPGLRAASDHALNRRAAALGERARSGAPLDDLHAEAFALVRESARRVLGQRPFDVQIAGGMAMHRGRVAEMPTGEGKTLAAVAPVFLNALSGRGAHVLTFNDYLARRDARWMGPVYSFLGLAAGFIREGMDTAERRKAYGLDVTYVTVKEAGFDLLRDGLCTELVEQVHRPFHFALVDEADSILIDEARIPLVIAGAAEQEDGGLARLAGLVRELDGETDFETDEYDHNIFLTERGVDRVERRLECGNLFAPGNVRTLAALRNALHAEYLLRRDVDYIVRGRRIELVDEFTGRVAVNRHWPDGLHAAVEVKEGLRQGIEGRILGSITVQHFVKLYPRVCGMTATALSAADELREMYGLEVDVIPPHRPCIRSDLPDVVFTHGQARDRALLDEIERVHATGRPVLAGTASVAESESLAGRLRARGIRCRVLNAKNDEREAAVVARAGESGAVTLSTNMAGRGTDIRLGGAAEGDRDRVVALGGLYVLGTHRHESVRIDDQLRGRAGRQGDPGASRLFISLEDDLLVRYGIERLIPRRLFPEATDDPVDSRAVRREVARAQRIVEGECFDARRRLYAYARILETQRQTVAGLRQAVLEDRADLPLLEQRARERFERLAAALGREAVRDIERRLTLLAIDRCWSEYLSDMQGVRDEAHLVALVGREPLAEFYKTAMGAFEQLFVRIDHEIVEGFRSLRVGPDGVDWDRCDLRGPSATWTYMVSDDVSGGNLLMSLANRPAIGLWGALLLWPVLLAWGVYLRLRRRRARRADATETGIRP